MIREYVSFSKDRSGFVGIYIPRYLIELCRIYFGDFDRVKIWANKKVVVFFPSKDDGLKLNERSSGYYLKISGMFAKRLKIEFGKKYRAFCSESDGLIVNLTDEEFRDEFMSNLKPYELIIARKPMAKVDVSENGVVTIKFNYEATRVLKGFVDKYDRFRVRLCDDGFVLIKVRSKGGYKANRGSYKLKVYSNKSILTMNKPEVDFSPFIGKKLIVEFTSDRVILKTENRIEKPSS